MIKFTLRSRHKKKTRENGTKRNKRKVERLEYIFGFILETELRLSHETNE